MMNTYALENIDEAARLEKQSALKNYSVQDEIEHFDVVFSKKDRVLDAGCGSGVLSRYLVNSFDELIVDACDISNIRIEQAKEINSQFNNKYINFFQSTLENLDKENSSYDHIFCRYVLQHLPNPLNVLQEFARIIKPGGAVYLIDTDGVLFNLHSDNQQLNNYLIKIKNSFPMDMYIGRKIPSLLKSIGLQVVDVKIKVMNFTGQDRLDEHQQFQERFKFIYPALYAILKNKEDTDKFVELYLEEMLKEENTLFYNKFLVTGRKLS